MAALAAHFRGIGPQIRRPRRGLRAQHAGKHRRHAGARHPWAVSGPPARRISASRVCSTASARSSRASSSPPTAIGITARAMTAWSASANSSPSCPASRKCWSSPISARHPDISKLPKARIIDDVIAANKGAEPHIRARAVQSPALHHVLQRHDRRAQMHRARPGRHAAAASQGTSPAFRREAGRPRVLLHHLRLDDVELAGLGPGLGRHLAAL